MLTNADAAVVVTLYVWPDAGGTHVLWAKANGAPELGLVFGRYGCGYRPFGIAAVDAWMAAAVPWAEGRGYTVAAVRCGPPGRQTC